MLTPVAFAVAGVFSACTPPQSEVSSGAIAVALAPGDGGLVALGTIVGTDPGGGGNFAVLVDTGTTLTTRGLGVVGSMPAGILPVTLRLLDIGGVARAQFDLVPVLEAPLGPVGVGTNLLHLEAGADGKGGGGILAGDLLQRFSVGLDYSAAIPTVSLLPAELSCSCALADACAAVLPFQLAGGGTLAFGDSVRSYPATRVTLDACLEPPTDPVGRGVVCTASDGTRQPGYEIVGAPGVDVRLLVATGFSGVLLGASAYDRLRGQGSAAALLAAGNTEPIFFSGHAAPIPAARAWLGAGSPIVASDGGIADGGATDGGSTDGGASSNLLAALALIGREQLLGPCAELARSRRLRYTAGHINSDPFASALAPSCGAVSCPEPRHILSCLGCVPGSACGSPDHCNDADQPAAAVVEISGPIPIYVVGDDAPILQEINFDVRPQLSDVEGVVGTELLSRLAARIDYPSSRILARCASPTGCTVFPRYVCPGQVGDCGPRGEDSYKLCAAPLAIPAYGPMGGTLCSGPPALPH